MTWLFCGKNKKKEPFTFEASSPKASVREALADLLHLYSIGNGVERLVARATTHLSTPPKSPNGGLFLIFKEVEDGFPELAGFWVVFGSNYLSEGVKGAPERDPPYASDMLDALTEEVWWKNLKTTGARKSWLPILIFEWPKELAFLISNKSHSVCYQFQTVLDKSNHVSNLEYEEQEATED